LLVAYITPEHDSTPSEQTRLVMLFISLITCHAQGDKHEYYECYHVNRLNCIWISNRLLVRCMHTNETITSVKRECGRGRIDYVDGRVTVSHKCQGDGN
jgi:hypothetical protein